MTVGRTETEISPTPEWIAPSLHRTPGRDPLSVQTITLDRIIPSLVPGILAQSRRARYLSLHAFLLDEYAQRRLPPSNSSLGRFILAREYEFALAVELCPRPCGSSPVGRQRTGPAVAEEKDSYERGESVENPLGGYGAFYRSPLAQLGLVARKGTVLGELATPVDVLIPNAQGIALAEAFRTSIVNTEYYNEHFLGTDPIPRDVLIEFAAAGCLCRLDEHLAERAAIRAALFDSEGDADPEEADQRRLSFGLFLDSVEQRPSAATSQEDFRKAVWERFKEREALSPLQTRVVSQWSALILKEYMQEALSAMWIDLCRTGLRQQPESGYTSAQLTGLLHDRLASERAVEFESETVAGRSDLRTSDFLERFLEMAGDSSLEDLRAWAKTSGHALSGLAYLWFVCRELPEPSSLSDTERTFLDIGVQRSFRQQGLLQVASSLQRHLEINPTLGDTVEWAMRRLIIDVHERVAYSKLPNFTFRFRWESGRLRFYNLGVEPFDLADMRHESMSQLTLDLGYWSDASDDPLVTPDGRALIEKAFS